MAFVLRFESPAQMIEKEIRVKRLDIGAVPINHLAGEGVAQSTPLSVEKVSPLLRLPPGALLSDRPSGPCALNGLYKFLRFI